MTSIRQFFKERYNKLTPLPAGMYHYQSPADAAEQYRLHLRLEPDGSGILIINASTVLHLNKTAAEFAYHFVKNTPEDQAVKTISARYRASRQDIHNDYHNFLEQVNSVVHTVDLDPTTYLNFERRDPYSGEVSAPYRVDCALTYKNRDGSEDAILARRAMTELTTEQWKSVLQKAWEAGIPHVIFTGGEPTLRTDLVDLVTFTESIGMVSGVITDGKSLLSQDLFTRLLAAGLDHIMIVLDDDDDSLWDMLNDLEKKDIHLSVHVTISHKDVSRLSYTLTRIAAANINFLSLSVKDDQYRDEMQQARQIASTLGLSLVWDLPVPYTQNHPVAMEQKESEEYKQGAGSGWIYVEPDGDVLPGQGILHKAGNFVETPWRVIWDALKKKN